jgi:DNA recombination protein RmuC
MMLPLVIGAVAALAGILVGFWLRSVSAAKRSAELERDLGEARNQLAQAQAQSSERAGFQALASEREKTIERVAAERDGLHTELHAKNEVERALTARISALDAELRKERESMAEKVTLLDKAERSLSNQFETLAGKILEEKSSTFSTSSQKELGVLLEPLKAQIKDFRDKVEQAQSDSKTGVAKLEGLIGSLGSLNQQLADEARNLTTALRGSAKSQGDWGEFILRDLLEKAGLREGEQFSFQQTFSGLPSENGDRAKSARTDVILLLPGGRNLIIDSKVSLTAYTDCVNATDDAARNAALKLHLASIRGHVNGLAKSRYDRLPGIESPDFVVLFVPIEPAFLLSLQNDPSLWADAYHQGILLVGPTTLLYVIRIVNVLWQQELQARSVRDVMNRGTELYDKFVGFVADLEAVGKGLRSADQYYSFAMKKLSEGRGNLVRQVEMLKELGIRTGKSLPRNLLDAAAVDQFELALPAEAESSEESKS